MTNNTVFGGVLTFLERLGVYDVLLPFLLVFTIVFATLEKTRVLGVEKIDGKEYTKKNLNAIVAFVLAFVVVASTNVVRVINASIANVVLILIMIISFLMLVGALLGTEELTLDKFPNWKKFLLVLIFIGIVLVFLNAAGWLTFIIGAVIQNYQAEWMATLILLIIVITFMVYVTRERKEKQNDK